MTLRPAEVGAGNPVLPWLDGGWLDDPLGRRSAAPAATLIRATACFPRFGITRLARQTGLDRIGIPVWSAIRPNARTLAATQGKGLDDDAAKVSAALEAIELATAERPAIPAMRTSTKAHAAAGRQACPCRSLIAAGAAPLPAEAEIDWVAGFDLVGECEVWLPLEAVMVDHARAPAGEPIRYWQSTDGLAAGNTAGEALLHALLERIERDATTLWPFMPLRQAAARCVDPAELGDAVSDLAARFGRAGLRLRLFDASAGVGPPTVLAVAADAACRPQRHFEVAAGSACDLSVDLAAIGAMVEAAQARLTIIAGARDDIAPERYAAAAPEDLLQILRLQPSPGAGLRARRHHDGRWRGLADVVAGLRQARVSSILAVPLQSADDPFAVVKVVVEDLENPPGERRIGAGRRALAAMMAAL